MVNVDFEVVVPPRADVTCAYGLWHSMEFSRERSAPWRGQFRGHRLTQVEQVQNEVAAAATESTARAAMLAEIKVEVAKDPQVRGDVLR